MTSPTGYGMQQAPTQGYGILPNANYLYGRQGEGYYPAGSFNAGIPQITQQGWAQQLAGLGQQMPFAQQAAGQAGNMLGQLGGMTGSSGFNAGAVPDILGVGSSMNFFDNPHLTGAIDAAKTGLTDTFNQNMAGMNRGMVTGGPGTLGSDRAGVAEGIAQQGLQRQLSDVESGMRMAGYNTGMQGYLQDRGQTLNAAQQAASNMFGLPNAMAGVTAMGMLPGQLQQQLGQTMGGIGQQQQAQMQGLFGAGANQWNWGREQPWQRLGQYGASISPFIQYGQANQGSTTQPPLYNPYPNAGVMGGLLQGAQAGLNYWQKNRIPNVAAQTSSTMGANSGLGAGSTGGGFGF